ncbi:MAG: hypothetical protein HKN29_02205 [Rhodothermales bacterium]|nr:hypothetical protein [Rhodothermales bacterium]
MADLPRFRSLILPLLFAVTVLPACDSNPVGPLDSSERLAEFELATVQYQAAPAAALQIDRSDAIMASGRDTVTGK